jgi:hypothetical protein
MEATSKGLVAWFFLTGNLAHLKILHNLNKLICKNS